MTIIAFCGILITSKISYEYTLTILQELAHEVSLYDKISLLKILGDISPVSEEDKMPYKAATTVSKKTIRGSVIVVAPSVSNIADKVEIILDKYYKKAVGCANYCFIPLQIQQISFLRGGFYCDMPACTQYKAAVISAEIDPFVQTNKRHWKKWFEELIQVIGEELGCSELKITYTELDVKVLQQD
ncbi:MAG TPA: hypothetical protein P5096_01260 [Patescibacteria group bacterium]|nr:hypothetical protein [Patescibacteria group bacterium]